MGIGLSLKKKIDLWLGGVGLNLIYFPVRLTALILRRKHTLQDPKKIVIIKILGGGSLLMIYPLLQELRRKFPKVQISLICGNSIKNFAETYGIFDQIKIINDKNAFSFIFSGCRNLLWLFRNCDVVIDLELHSRMTTLYTTIAMVRNRIGLIDSHSLWRKRIYTHAIYHNTQGEIFQAYDAIAALFKIEKIDVPAAQKKFAERISLIPIAVNETDFCTVGLGCSDLANERQMSLPQWAEFLTAILKANNGIRFVFLGNQADQKLVEELLRKFPQLQSACESLCGKIKLQESLRWIQKSKIFLGIDSGLVHLARFLNTPTISFWGPTSPVHLLRPLSVPELILKNPIHCSPCVHFTETPPCLGNNICMNHQHHLPKILDFVRQVYADQNVTVTKKSFPLVASTWVYLPDSPVPRKAEVSYY